MARPEIPYDPEMAGEICERIATSELGLEQVLADRKSQGLAIVSSTTIYKWLSNNPEFAEQSARARRMQAELLHDRAQQVAQTPLIGKVVKDDEKNGRTETTSDNVERSKLIVQTLLKRAGQLDPKKYGEKIQAEHTGPEGGPIQAQITVKFVKSNNDPG
jgi:hypothetical protein